MAEMKSGEVVSVGGGAVATESRKVGKARQKRRYADVDGPGANPEPELGPRGPTLKKQSLKGFVGLQPADSIDNSQHFESERETRARHKNSSPGASSSGECFHREPEPPETALKVERCYRLSYENALDAFPEGAREEDSEAIDPAVSPSSVRKVADAARPSASSSTSAAPVPVWRSFLCLGNGK